MEKRDSFDRRRAVVTSVVELFKDIRIDRKSFKGKKYILWIKANDETKEEVFVDLTMKNANGLTLEEEIIDNLFKKGFEIGSLGFRHGSPENNLDRLKKKEIADIILYLEETSIMVSSQVSNIVIKARLTLALGSPGALKQQEGYLIDSTNVPYNIGRVIEPGDTTNRVNHIEIIDENRIYSSRSLAHIGFSEAIGGFFIQREKPTETNPVEIIRKNEIKKLNNESAVVALKDGDIIKLRHIILDFHIVPDIK